MPDQRSKFRLDISYTFERTALGFRERAFVDIFKSLQKGDTVEHAYSGSDGYYLQWHPLTVNNQLFWPEKGPLRSEKNPGIKWT